MSNELVVTSRGMAQVLADREKLAQQLGKEKALAKDLNKEWAANEAEIKKLGRAAQQIMRDTETATEKFNRKLQETKNALQGNTREQELLKRATTALTVEYLKQLDGNKKLTAAQQHQVDVKRKYQASLKQELEMMPKLTSETHRLMGEYTQTGKALDNLTKKQAKFVSPESLAGLKGFVGKVAAVMAPLAGFANAIEAGNDRLRQYGGQAVTAAKAGGGLAQLAGGDPAKLKGLLDASKISYLEGGFENLSDAHRLTFELESGGIMNDRKFLSRLQSAGVADASQVAKSTSLVAAAFGRKEAGNTEQLTSKGLAAAGPATGANLGDILEGVASAAASAKPLGISDEEVFALVSRIAEVTGSGKEAGTRAEALFRSMAAQGFADDPRAALREKIGKSDAKIAKLQTRLKSEERAFSGSKDSRAAAYTASETKRRATFDEREQERIAGVQEQLDDTKVSIERGYEDLQNSDTPHGRRGAQRRIDDAKKRLARLQEDVKPRAYVAAPSPAEASSKTLSNIRQQIATETGSRDALQAQLATTAPRQKLALADLMTSIGNMGLEQSGLNKFLGRQEAAQAFDIARDIPAFNKRLGEINAAQSSGLATKVVDSALTVPEVATRRKTLGTKAWADLMLEKEGLQRQRIDADIEARLALLQKELGKVPTFVIDKVMNGGEIAGIPLPGINTFIPDDWEDPWGGKDLPQRPPVVQPPAQAPSRQVNDMDQMAREMEKGNQLAADSLRVQQQFVTVIETVSRKMSEWGFPTSGE